MGSPPLRHGRRSSRASRASPRPLLPPGLSLLLLTLLASSAGAQAAAAQWAEQSALAPGSAAPDSAADSARPLHHEKQKALRSIQRTLETYSDESIKRMLGADALPAPSTSAAADPLSVSELVVVVDLLIPLDRFAPNF